MAWLVPYLTIFLTILLAELGDKTQLAVLSYGAGGQVSKWGVFAAASLALVISTAIAVAAASLADRYLTVLPIKLIAGILFILIGCWTVYGHFRA